MSFFSRKFDFSLLKKCCGKFKIYTKVSGTKDVMEGKLFQKCTHLLYCNVYCNVLYVMYVCNVNTRRMSKPDMGSIFHIKKSMKYSGHRKLLCQLSKLSKFNALNLLGY